MAVKKKSGNTVASQASLFDEVDKQAPKAFAENKDSEAVVKGGGLPPGIEGGVAQFVGYKIDRLKDGDRKGTIYITYTGVVKKPDDCAGLQTRQTIYIEDSKDKKKTKNDRIAEAMNVAKLLGADLSAGSKFADMKPELDTLAEDRPHFRFRTWKGKATKQYPNPKTNETWMQAFDFEEDGAGEEIVEEEVTETEDSSEELPEVEVEVEEISEDEVVTEDGEEVEEVEETEEVEEEEGEFKPAIGDIYNYKPKDKEKAVNVEVVAVLESKQVVTVKDPKSKKLYKMVPWSSLESAD